MKDIAIFVSLPDGEAAVGVTTYQGRVIVACQSGKIFEVVGTKGCDVVRVKEIPLTVKQATEAISHSESIPRSSQTRLHV